MSRRYPPLLFLAAALVLAVFSLPSALILPQASPAQTLEYAPVPPNGSSPPGGNYSGLGLGASSTLGSDGFGGVGLTAPPGQGGSPTAKQCIGSPPRQTEDPLSPPCVPYFQGDNGGATYRGVTRSEIRLLIYVQGNITQEPNNGNGTTPSNQYVDLSAQPQATEFEGVTDLRNWLRYFNERYQTYGRRVHGYVYFSSSSPSSAPVTPTQRRQDAADNSSSRSPFADIEDATVTAGGAADAYESAMAADGTLNFSSPDLTSQSFYAQYPGMIWSFRPSLEEVAANYSAFLCQKVKPYRVSFSGNPGENGTKRVYGLLSSADPRRPDLQQLAGLVHKQAVACGITFAREHTYPDATCGVGPSNGEQEAANMADFKTAHVTTIIWPGGCETRQSNDAQNIGYLPEWIMADAGADTNAFGAGLQGQAAWSHAWIVTPEPFKVALNGGNPVEAACSDAYLSVAPQANATDVGFACAYYDALRQFFTGVQVAGPRLTPSSIDAGFHAIPAHPSTGPSQPACFYDPGDYTCVKDDTAQWWDVNGGGANGSRANGCWRMGDHGTRYLRGRWPPGDVWALHQADDPCAPS